MFWCVRTTLTLDDDVAALLRRIQKQRNCSFKELVNTAMREGLKNLEGQRKHSAPYRIRPVSLGRCLVPSLDDASEVLAVAEGESFK